MVTKFYGILPQIKSQVNRSSVATFQPLFTSSPISFNEEESHCETESADMFTNQSDESVDDELYHDSGVTISEFQDKVSTLQTKHRLSAAAVKDILSLFAFVLPLPNRCPSFFRYKKGTIPDDEPLKIPVSQGTCYILPFKQMMSNVIKRYPNVCLTRRLKQT